MNRFLKGELEHVKIPRSFRQQIRNAAWQKIRQSEIAKTKSRLSWLPATAAGILLLLLAWSTISSDRPLKVDLAGQVTPLVPIEQRPIFQALLPVPALAESLPFQTGGTTAQKKPGAVPTAAKASLSGAAMPELTEFERITVELRLPETGARLIWIKDKNFDLEGEFK